MGKTFSLIFSISILLIANTSSFAMVGGTMHPMSSGSSSRFPATITINQGCTAAKIGPRTFITAAHCVYNYSTGGWAAPFDGSGTLYITNHPNPITGTTWMPASVEVVIPAPGYRLGCLGTPPCYHEVMKATGPDVALFRINEETTWIPEASIEFNRRLNSGEPVTLTGYGFESYSDLSSRVPSDPAFADGRLKYTSSGVEDAALPLSVGDPAGAFTLFHFFSRGIAFGMPAGINYGDSGGPVYSSNGKIVGINSAMGGSVASPFVPRYHVHARLDAEELWISANIR